MKLLYRKSDIVRELNSAVENKTIRHWYWVYFLHDNTPGESIENTADFIIMHRYSFHRFYTTNRKLYDSVKRRIPENMIREKTVCYAPSLVNKLLHSKMYFFGNKEKIGECTKWIAFIGSYNAQMDKQDDMVRISPPHL
jgi:hypothetical protein